MSLHPEEFFLPYAKTLALHANLCIIRKLTRKQGKGTSCDSIASPCWEADQLGCILAISGNAGIQKIRSKYSSRIPRALRGGSVSSFPTRPSIFFAPTIPKPPKPSQLAWRNGATSLSSTGVKVSYSMASASQRSDDSNSLHN